MTLSDLHRRYDGPIPPWEKSDAASPLRPRLLRFHRSRAQDAARAILSELRRASATQSSSRLNHWLNAVRLLARYQDERLCHSRLVASS